MRFNRFDLNLLVSLDALLIERNVTRAGERVFVSQSAMSWTLARLREHFGDPLLVATGRQMVLTPFAQALAAPVRELLMQTQVVLARRPSVSIEGVERTIHVMTSDYVSTTILGEAFRRAAVIAPGLRLDLRSLDEFSPEILDRSDLDLLIGAVGILSDRHPREMLAADDYVGLVWQQNGMVGDVIDADRYRTIGHVTTQWHGGRVLTVDHLSLRERGIKRQDEIIIPDFTLIPSFLMGTDRLATLPWRLASILAERWPLRVVTIALPLPKIEIGMQWNRHQQDDPALAWLRETLKDVSDLWPHHPLPEG